MKKTTVKKLSLKMIKVAQLSDNGAHILGGNSAPTAPGTPTGSPTGTATSPTSRATTGPAGPPTCATGTGNYTVACPHG